MDELLKLAVSNLNKSAGEWAAMGSSKADGGKGRFLFPVQEDTYTVSLLLDEKIFEQLKLQDGALAAAPARGSLLIVEPGDPDLEKLFLERIQTAAQEGLRPLCPIPLVRKDGRWESWTAPAGHPHRIAYSELAVDYFSEVYAVQQPMLYRYTEDWDDPCFIASYMAKADENTGVWTSATVWSSGIDSLLPKADVIAFVDSSSEDPVIGTIPWDVAEAKLSKWLVPFENHYPPRFLTKGFPDLDTLLELARKD